MKYILGLVVLIILAAGIYLAVNSSPPAGPAAGPSQTQTVSNQTEAAADNLPSSPADQPGDLGGPDVQEPPTTPPPGAPAPAAAIPATPTAGEPAPPVKEFKMTARRFAFEPAEITVKLGDQVRLVVTSTDVTHGLSIPQFNVSEVLLPNETKTIEFVADKRGRWPFACSVYCGAGHSDMKGALIVE